MAVAIGLAPRAGAQGFVVPYVGTNIGGDSGCADLATCEGRTTSVGIAFGSHSGLAGFEGDLGYARDFFGKTPEGGSSVVTATANLVLGFPSGPVRPYVVGGVGLIKTHVGFDVSSLVSTSDNNIGWDMGGGLIVGTGRIGIRGDLRRFKTFGDLPIPVVPLAGESLEFWRASAGLFLGF